MRALQQILGIGGKLVCAMALLCAVSCVKDRTCECMPSEGTSTFKEILNIDGGMECEDVTTMGKEERINGEYVATVQKVKCTEIAKNK